MVCIIRLTLCWWTPQWLPFFLLLLLAFFMLCVFLARLLPFCFTFPLKIVSTAIVVGEGIAYVSHKAALNF